MNISETDIFTGRSGSRRNISILDQEAKFEVLLPEGDSLRYWCSCDSLRPVEHTDEGRRVYVWEVQNLPKLSKDAVGSNSEDYSAIVYTAPRKFEIDGYAGDLSSWKNFGVWDYNLYKEKDILPDPAIKEGTVDHISC